MVAWRLGVAATIAEENYLMQGDRKLFWKAKLSTLKFIVSALSHNLSIAKTLTELEEDLASIEI